jgi:RimJ/RimL family protein N-acetyltransferase
VRLRGGGPAIGYVQATVLAEAKALIAYEFGSAWWGRGLALEATTSAIDELRGRYGVTVVGAVLKQANHRSRALLARLGMRVAGPDEFPRGMAEVDEAAIVLDL